MPVSLAVGPLAWRVLLAIGLAMLVMSVGATSDGWRVPRRAAVLPATGASWMDIGLLTGWLLLMPIGLILVLGDAAKLPPEVVTSALWWAALGLTAAVLLGRRLAWTAPIVVVLILALFGIDGDQPRWWALPFHAVTPATAGLAVTVYALAAGFYLWFAQRPRGRWTVMWGAAARD